MTDAPQLIYYADLIEYHGRVLGDKPYILHGDNVVTFAEFDRGTCRAANGITAQGGRPGDGVAILMGNCPEFLYVFNGMPRVGLYSVPMNVALKGDGLRYVLTHSDVKYLVVDDTFYPNVAELGSPMGAIEEIFVRRTTEAPLPQGVVDLESVLDAPDTKPDHDMDPEAIAFIIYTSGTTGFPKGVVNRNWRMPAEGLKVFASVWVQPDDVLYTCLPLFHANALLLTAAFAMGIGVPFGLDKRFSASRIWDSLRRYGATQFNALGAMIPILMKQPEKPDDAANPVRRVNSAACPANLWEAFEKRFGVTIWEGYGAVDGAGVMMGNYGTAPVGSVGKPDVGVDWKLVDDDGNEVPQGEVGELVVAVTNKMTQSVEYYKNAEASAEKVRDGLIHTGDLFYADEDRNLYFVDRKTDSIRRRGENMSSWEVENAVEKHPDVAECAAFGVPSELGEDEVMIWVRPAEVKQLDLKSLMRHCAENMAYFMVPRYVDIVDEIPRTETHRVMKMEMKERGVTDRTWDREKEMPDFKLK